jgi:hypothetical protein
MENLSIADVMALRRDDERSDGYYRNRHTSATAITGVALGASLGGAALLAALVGIWGVNSASKARAMGNQNTMNAQAKANSDLVALLANRVVADNQRADSINIDVAQTLRSLTGATATGGTSTASSQALATAEALALLNQQNNTNPLANVTQNSCALRVTRVAEQNCGCGCQG